MCSYTGDKTPLNLLIGCTIVHDGTCFALDQRIDYFYSHEIEISVKRIWCNDIACVVGV